MKTEIISLTGLLFLLLQNSNAQNIGIGTTIPKAAFNVAANNTVLFGTDTSGSGSKMIWYPTKSALRAGFSNLDEWNNNNVGIGSVAFGNGTNASGGYSTSFGLLNIATGEVSVAMGNQNTATGFNSTSFGFGTSAIGDYAATMGINTSARSFGEIVIGTYNTDYTPVSNNNWNASDRLFSIGNGTYSNNHDAIVILKNGNIGIGESNPGFPLNFYGSLGDKISLFGTTANASCIGFGIQSGLFQMHSYQASDDIAFGYGSSSNFTEQMRIKGNGNVGIGTSTPSARLDVNGFTKLGEFSPAIKTKLITGITATTEGAAAGVATGLDATKILAVNIFVTQGTGFLLPPSFTNSPGYEYQFTVSNGILALFNKSANSFAILSKPFTALITYKE